jgi:hypothetical protein
MLSTECPNIYIKNIAFYCYEIQHASPHAVVKKKEKKKVYVPPISEIHSSQLKILTQIWFE